MCAYFKDSEYNKCDLQRMLSESCPQCDKLSNNSNSRLVQDTCGHLKCRMCILEDDLACRLCNIKKINTTPVNYKTVSIQQNNAVPPDSSHCKKEKKEEHIEKLKTGWARTSAEAIKCEANVLKTEISQNLNLDNSTKIETTAGITTPVVYSSLIAPIERDTCKQTKLRKHKKVINKNINLPSHIVLKLPTLRTDCAVYECTVCRRSFKARGHYRYHASCANGVKPLECHMCHKGFVSRSHLQFHLQGHAGLKPYKCVDCGKSFSQRSGLNRHEKTHSRDKSYCCKICKLSFASEPTLKIHYQQHRKIKPYVCPKCNKAFSDRSNLRKHCATHNRIKSYICEVCGTPLSSKWSLTCHRGIHSRFRPHECSVCQKTFSDLKGLQRHHIIHTNDKLYNCQFCAIKCKRKDNLVRHIRNTHNCQSSNLLGEDVAEKDTEIEPSSSSININEQKICTSNTSYITTNEYIFKNKEENGLENKSVLDNSNNTNVVKDKSNTVNVIQSTSQAKFSPPYKSVSIGSKSDNITFKAVPVINSPKKLLVRHWRDSVKHLNDSVTHTDPIKCLPLKKQVTNMDSFESSLNAVIENCKKERIDIYKKILSPMSHIQDVPEATGSNVDKFPRTSEQIEVYKKILIPHYDNEIKMFRKDNTECDSPSCVTYTALEPIKTASLYAKDIIECTNRIQPLIPVSVHCQNEKHLTNQVVQERCTINNHVSTIKPNPSNETKEPDKLSTTEMHWKRRNAQNFNKKEII